MYYPKPAYTFIMRQSPSSPQHVHTSPLRHYRAQHAARKGSVSFQVVVEETDLWITAPQNMHHEAAMVVRQLRGHIASWNALQPAFANSLAPVSVPPHAPEVIRRMAAAASLLGVGPMASVAGVIAQLVALHLHTHMAYTLPEAPAHHNDILVENGGDIYMISSGPRTVGLLPDPRCHAVVGFMVPASAMPTAVCSSSATVGHSLSLGHGELACVVAPDAAIADAAATAFCNMLQGPDDVERVTTHAAALQQHGIRAVFVQCAGRIGVWGDLELTALEHGP